jgi:hypothetical protein
VISQSANIKLSPLNPFDTKMSQFAKCEYASKKTATEPPKINLAAERFRSNPNLFKALKF